MMALAALIAGLVAFIAVLKVTGVEQQARAAIGIAHGAIAVLADPDLGDDDKERHVQRATLKMLKSAAILLGIGAAACLAAAVFVLGGAALGLFTTTDALGLATSWSFLLWSSLGAILLWLVMGRAGGKTAAPASEATAEVPYSALDRALHNYAFASPGLQRRMAATEDRLWRRSIARAETGRPVFVTSLPRAGTTILLELLARQPEFAAASYRHMPFTLSPLLWRRISGAMFKANAKSERAHGDGISVNMDSPEAFEEMTWMAFWPERYQGDRVGLWEAEDRNPDFESFLDRHMRKIVAGEPGARRYLSKNNANIARLPLLGAAFPDAQIVIPIRDPASQAVSLLRQHARFTDLHARDRFARQYMEGIGHFEFGAALRPIAFPGAPGSAEGADHPDYWLTYWIAAYEHVLAAAPRDAIFIDHAALSRQPVLELPRLAHALGLADPTALLAEAGMFRAPRPVPDLPGASPVLLKRAQALYAELRDRGSAQLRAARRVEKLAS
jgi:hypothetical protein